MEKTIRVHVVTCQSNSAAEWNPRYCRLKSLALPRRGHGLSFASHPPGSQHLVVLEQVFPDIQLPSTSASTTSVQSLIRSPVDLSLCSVPRSISAWIAF